MNCHPTCPVSGGIFTNESLRIVSIARFFSINSVVHIFLGQPISIFYVFNWNAECKAYSHTNLSAKSWTACFKNVWLLLVSRNEPRLCFALRWFAFTINLVTKQSHKICKIIHPLSVEVDSEAYSCSILRNFEEFGCLTSGMVCC